MVKPLKNLLQKQKADDMTGCVAYSVLSLIVDPGVVSLISARPYTYMEIHHEMFSTIILLLLLIQEGLLSVTRKSMYIKYWLTALPELAQENVWLC